MTARHDHGETSCTPPFEPEKVSMQYGSYDEERPLVFTHIPKTAGTSMWLSLERALGTRGLHGYDGITFGDFDQWDTFDASRWQEIYEHGGLVFPPQQRLITGHFSYPTTKAHYPNAQFVTILREPRARLMSLWTYWRQLEDWDINRWGAWAHNLYAARGTWTEFLTYPGIVQEVDNVMTRYLLWQHECIPNGGYIDPKNDQEILAAAFKVLDAYDFVDVIENRQWTSAFGEWLGRDFDLLRLNETGPQRFKASLPEQLTPESFSYLSLFSRLDFELWKYVANASMPGLNVDVLADATWAKALAKAALQLA